MFEFVLFKDRAGETRWRLRSVQGGKIVANSGEGYTNEQDAQVEIMKIKENAATASVTRGEAKDVAPEYAEEVDAPKATPMDEDVPLPSDAQAAEPTAEEVGPPADPTQPPADPERQGVPPAEPDRTRAFDPTARPTADQMPPPGPPPSAPREG